MRKMIRTAFILLLALSVLLSLAACASESAAASTGSPAGPTEAALDVIAMIDGIPEMAEDGSNASRSEEHTSELQSRI